MVIARFLGVRVLWSTTDPLCCRSDRLGWMLPHACSMIENGAVGAVKLQRVLGRDVGFGNWISPPIVCLDEGKSKCRWKNRSFHAVCHKQAEFCVVYGFDFGRLPRGFGVIEVIFDRDNQGAFNVCRVCKSSLALDEVEVSHACDADDAQKSDCKQEDAFFQRIARCIG